MNKNYIPPNLVVAPRRQLAAAAPGRDMQRGGWRRCWGRHDTGAARTPRALLRRTPRAAA